MLGQLLWGLVFRSEPELPSSLVDLIHLEHSAWTEEGLVAIVCICKEVLFWNGHQKERRQASCQKGITTKVSAERPENTFP